jgi:hypothetical protein
MNSRFDIFKKNIDIATKMFKKSTIKPTNLMDLSPEEFKNKFLKCIR